MTGRVKEDNDKVEESFLRTALSIWQRLGRRIFWGRTFGFSTQTISSVTCQQKSENVATHDFVEKGLCEERRPPLKLERFC